MKLTSEQIHQIQAYLTDHGLLVPEVHIVVLDHICTMLKHEPDVLDLASANALIKAEFPPQVIQQIQADTLYYLTLKSKITMLKFIFISGYMATCLLLLGSFLQNHPIMLPEFFYYYGIPILNITGIVICCFGFLPSLFLYAYQRSLERVKQ